MRREPLPQPPLAKTSSVNDERIHLYVQESAFYELIEAFIAHRLVRPPEKPDTRDVWCDWVFALITLGGICGDGALKAISLMRTSNVLPHVCHGYILLPRLNDAIPVYVHDLVSLATLRLIAHLSRNGRGGRNRCRSYPHEAYLLPNRTNPLSDPSDDEIKLACRYFDQWLATFRRSAVPDTLSINTRRLLKLSRCRISHIYSRFVAGRLVGNHLDSPIDSHSVELLKSYRSEFHFPEPTSCAIDLDSHEPPSVRKPRSLADSAPQITREIIATIRHTAKPYYTAQDRSCARQVRKDVAESLEQLAEKYQHTLTSEPDPLNFIYQQRLAVALNPDRTSRTIALFNGACLARWMAQNVKSQTSNTVRSKLNDMATIMRAFPEKCLTELTYTDVATLQSEYKPRSKQRRRSTLNRFRAYVTANLHLITKLPFLSLSAAPYIEHTQVLSLQEVSRVIADLLSLGEEGEVVVASILLGAFFGLRISETCNLWLCDLWLAGTPTIYVFDAKRTRMRVVTGIQVPQDALLFLRKLLERRLAQTHEGHKHRLLATSSGPMSEGRIRALIDRVTTGLGINCSHHSFRHFWVNRLLARGVSLIEIGHLAHHASLETTVSSYVHIGPLLQREQLQSHVDSVLDQPGFQYVPISSLGKLLGMSSRATSTERVKECRIGLLHENEVGLVHPGRQGGCVKLIDAIRFLAAYLCDAQ